MDCSPGPDGGVAFLESDGLAKVAGDRREAVARRLALEGVDQSFELRERAHQHGLDALAGVPVAGNRTLAAETQQFLLQAVGLAGLDRRLHDAVDRLVLESPDGFWRHVCVLERFSGVCAVTNPLWHVRASPARTGFGDRKQ